MPVTAMAVDMDRQASSSYPTTTGPASDLRGVKGWRSGPTALHTTHSEVTETPAPAAAAAVFQQPPSTPTTGPAGLAVPHVRQMYNWDCGLACVLMVLRAAGARGLDLRTLRSAAGTRSVWTVDLAHLLSAFGRCDGEAAGGGGGKPGGGAASSSSSGVVSSITLTTTWAGANPAYAGEAFYAATLEADRVRVGALFAGAPAAGVSVETRRVLSSELGARLIGGRTAIIALVDKSILAAGVRGGEAAEAKAAAAGPSTPDRPPSAASPLAAQAPPSSPMAGAGSSDRTSPRLALRRRLSSTSTATTTTTATTTSGGPPALATTSLSPSPEPSASSPGPGGGACLHAEPPLPAGWVATPSAGATDATGRRRHGYPPTRGTYLGHYVVLCGYDPAAHAFAFRDPAAGPGEGCGVVPGGALDAARWAWGTDEDLLLVELAG